MYTSLKLSKLLADNGFEGRGGMYYGGSKSVVDESTLSFQSIGTEIISKRYKKYDILNDLCVKYAKEMFGEDGEESEEKIENFLGYKGWSGTVFAGKYYEYCSHIIINFLQQNKQDEAEEYIWEHCKFNPNNK